MQSSLDTVGIMGLAGTHADRANVPLSFEDCDGWGIGGDCVLESCQKGQH